MKFNNTMNTKKGLFWEINVESDKVYLLGSVHLGRQEEFPLRAEIESAFNSVPTLIVEVLSENLKTKLYINKQTLLKMQNRNPKKVPSHVNEMFNKRKKVLNIDDNVCLEKHSIGFIQQLITGKIISQTEYNMKYGIDRYFLKKAKGKKEIIQLETIEEQIEKLYNTPEEIFYDELNIPIDKLTEDLNRMVNCVFEGNQKELLSMLYERKNSKATQQYNNMMIKERNYNMANQIDEYIRADKSCFIVLGAAHFIGYDGIVEILKRKGYKVNRI